MNLLLTMLVVCQLLLHAIFAGSGVDQSTRPTDLRQQVPVAQQCQQAQMPLGQMRFTTTPYGVDSEHTGSVNYNSRDIQTTHHSTLVSTMPLRQLITGATVRAVFAAELVFSRTANSYLLLAVFALVDPPGV